MLLNNFKPLVDFYEDTPMVNVLGDTVYKYHIMKGSNAQGNYNEHHNHATYSNNLTYDYETNPNTNSFTDELELYNWTRIVGITGSDTSSDNNRDARENGFVIFVGSGDTAVTAADYCLDSALELAVLDASCYHNEYQRTEVRRTFQNNTVNAVTINEVGLYVFTQNNLNFEPGDTRNFPLIMIGRRVLETPVTLQVGDSYTFTYVIDMSNITFTEA